MKFKLTDETKEIYGKTLYRVECIEEFYNGDNKIKVGDKGGFVEKESNLADNAWIYDNAMVCTDAKIYGNARTYGEARIYKERHVCWFSVFGSRNDTTTLFKTKTGWNISCGYFLGTLEEFAYRVEKTHKDTKHYKEYKLIIEIMKNRINSEE